MDNFPSRVSAIQRDSINIYIAIIAYGLICRKQLTKSLYYRGYYIDRSCVWYFYTNIYAYSACHVRALYNVFKKCI